VRDHRQRRLWRYSRRKCTIKLRPISDQSLTPQRTASTLLNRGRLNLPNLTRLSGLRPSQTTNALIILIQHGLVLTNGSSFWKESDLDLYDFDLEQCLLRLRWARILAIAKHRFDELVGLVSLSQAVQLATTDSRR
jgi:DNA-directed RNA polymerase III subunit RPC3